MQDGKPINKHCSPKNKYVIWDEKFNFRTYFDRDTGNYLRSGILNGKDQDTGIEPFRASFPHLLDIGIMGHCEHGLSGKCRLAGIQCYQSGGDLNLPNMSFADFKSIVDQCEGKVQQLALGGRGDPDMHEDLEKMLAYCLDKGIVPNLTTSGYGLTQEKARIIAENCGAAAVSWYRTVYTERAVKLLVQAGITVNLHYILGKDSIDEAIEILRENKLPEGVSRIIFLLFKPVGQRNYDNVLKAEDKRVEILFSLFDKPEITAKIGYDSCCVPALVNYNRNIDPRSFDSCEGSRFSAYISADLQMTPCSFVQEAEYSIDLRVKTLSQAWESEEFNQFRSKLRDACPDCLKRDICFGGCPNTPEIVLCQKKQAILSGGMR